MIFFKDISKLVMIKFKRKREDGRMLRFLDADELKIITRGEHVIFRADNHDNSKALKTFII